ncbi:Adenylosuccinate synthetase [Whalleya microplaca]|nr:Adenylosuccinate synthetase [Whalleya microplaca]
MATIKGKRVDVLASNAKFCARAAGGHNAGHSIVANGVSYSFHLLPSGLMNPQCLNLIGLYLHNSSGVVFHVATFFFELAQLEEKGLENDRVFVSDRVSIDLDLHIAVDGLEKVELGSRKLGTTGRGIGLSYPTKASRSGIKLAEVFDAELFEGDLLKYDELERFKSYRTQLAKYSVDGVALLKEAQDRNTDILIEGANALMLDIDYGTYSYVTSSNTGLGGVFPGLAINPRKIREIIGVVKAYTTRVGEGPFVTEDTGEVGTKLQDIGREWGVSTGRKLDLVVVKYSTAINHYTALNLTKLFPLLKKIRTIEIAVGYKDQTGQKVPLFPASLSQLERVEVIYHEMPGWLKPTTKTRNWDDLPKEARDYVEFIENFIGVQVKWIGTGPDRDDMIVRGS